MSVAVVPAPEERVPVLSAPPPAPGLAMSHFERAAVTGVVAGLKTEKLAEVLAAARATAFAGDGDSRRRALARAAAREDVYGQQVAALLAAAVGSDNPAVAKLDKALTASTSRLLRILEQLRLESTSSRRVLVQACGAVTIAAEERG